MKQENRVQEFQSFTKVRDIQLRMRCERTCTPFGAFGGDIWWPDISEKSYKAERERSGEASIDALRTGFATPSPKISQSTVH